MKTKFLLIIGLAFHLTTFSARCAEPSSGYILTAEYGLNAKGEAVGQKRYTKIYFSGANTRIEQVIGDNTASVTVGGENSWSSVPSAGRLLFPNTPAPAGTVLNTYPATVRRSFERFFGKREKVADEKIKDIPCWKYAWHEPERIVGDVGSSAKDVTYWVYADPEFPCILAYQSSIGGKHELLDFKLNTPVAPELFAPPVNLSGVQRFQMPKGKFVIEFVEDRASKMHGWKSRSHDLYQGDGTVVTRTYRSETTHADGKMNTFEPPAETVTYAQAAMNIANRLQQPMWFSMRKTGTAEMLKFPCETLENIVESLDDKTWWITDHPQLGTITLQIKSDSPSESSTRGVTRLEVEK